MRKTIAALVAALFVIASPATAMQDPHVPACTEAVCSTHPPVKAEPDVQVAYLLMEEPISGGYADQVLEQMAAIDKAGVRAVVVEINSPGGSVSAGLLISKAFEKSPATIYCVIDGLAASMAFFILQSCDVRIMTERSTLMAHNPSAYAVGFGGQEEEWRTQGQNMANALRAMGRALARHCSRRLNITFEQFWSKIERGQEYWLESSEALEVGAVNWAVPGLVEALAIVQAMVDAPAGSP